MKLVRDKPTKSFRRSSRFPSLTAPSPVLPSFSYFFFSIFSSLPSPPLILSVCRGNRVVDYPFFSTDLGRLREKRGGGGSNDTFSSSIRFVFHTPFHPSREMKLAPLCRPRSFWPLRARFRRSWRQRNFFPPISLHFFIPPDPLTLF